MSQILSRSTQLTSLAVATLITVALQGALLMGFDAAARPETAQPVLAVTAPVPAVGAAHS